MRKSHPSELFLALLAYAVDDQDDQKDACNAQSKENPPGDTWQ